jgi:hypothetical protein
MERPNKNDYLTSNQIEYNKLLCKYYDALEAYIDVLEKQLTLTDVGCSLPSKEAMCFKELEEYKEEKEWDDRVNRRDFAKGFISCYKWITNQEFKVR